MQKAINAFRFNVKLSHCLTRKKKHDLDQETTKKSLECKRTTAHYIHVPFAKYHIMGVWETSTVWILWHYQSKTQACIYSQLPIIRSREIEKSLSYQEFELLGV